MGAIYRNAGAPSAGTSQVWTITIGGTPTGGTFKLSLDGLITGAITWSSTNNTLVANVDAALEALGNIGTGNVTTAVGTMTAGVGTLTVTATGALVKMLMSNLGVAANNLTGTDPTVEVAITTPGVDATKRGAAKGALLLDTTNGIYYVNTGTAYAPTWTSLSGNSPELNTLAAAIPTAAVADIGALTVGSDIAAFTDPPSAAEMALLRTFVNANKADIATIRTKVNALLAELRTAGIITP